jgi:hypothetical protein
VKNVIYQKTTLSASDSVDGESPEIIYCTEEANGYAVFVHGYDGKRLLKWFDCRWEAVEYAVYFAQEQIALHEEEAKADGELLNDQR